MRSGCTLMSTISLKPYQCAKCGHVKQIDTNHYGECYSWGHYNTCPKCPPHAKYPEYGGNTRWICAEQPPQGEVIPETWQIVAVKVTQ